VLVRCEEADRLGYGLSAVRTRWVFSLCPLSITPRIKARSTIGMTTLIDDWFPTTNSHTTLITDTASIELIVFDLFLYFFFGSRELGIRINGDIEIRFNRMFCGIAFKKTHQSIFGSLSIEGMSVCFILPTIYDFLTLWFFFECVIGEFPGVSRHSSLFYYRSIYLSNLGAVIFIMHARTFARFRAN
jgi:hypothetical protein